jgi:trigger factor
MPSRCFASGRVDEVTEVSEESRFERMVTIAIDGPAIEAAKGKAARRLSREIKIKGFRPGKAPRQLVEVHVGAERLRREAIDEALPDAVSSALLESGLTPAVLPRVIATRDVGDGVEVDLRVTLWPEVDELPDYRGRRIEVRSPKVEDADLDAQVERMRLQFAELEDVEREGFDGDYVLIDVRARSGEEEIAAVSASDLLYEIGSAAFLEGLDQAVGGKKAGDIIEFASTLPEAMGELGGRAVEVRVLVKQVKAKRLPELTDAWVDEVSEFETVEQMRSVLRDQLGRVRVAASRAELEERLLEQLREEMDLRLPDDLVLEEAEAVLHRFAHRLEARRVTLDQYLAVTGQDREALLTDARSQATLNLRTRILLEGVARGESLEVGDDELSAAISALASGAKKSVDEYRLILEKGGQEKTLAGDILMRKAIACLLDATVAVDADGNVIEFPAEDAESGDSGSGEGVGEGEMPELTEVEE